MKLKSQIKRFTKHASWYDIVTRYGSLGFDKFFRKKVIENAGIKKSYVVADVACGTGLNFPFLIEAVGKEGKIYGIDVTAAMLDKAKQKITGNDWKNIELIHRDVSTWKTNQKFDTIICTIGLSEIPNYEKGIDNIYRMLKRNGKFVIWDGKRASFIINLLEDLYYGIFGIKTNLNIKPWIQIRNKFRNVKLKEYFFGSFYVLSAQK